jgi:carbon storage regulator
MLVVSRKEGEGIRIGGGIVVRVVRAGKGSVRIGIDAPSSVPIAREELPLQVPPVAGAVVEVSDEQRDGWVDSFGRP